MSLFDRLLRPSTATGTAPAVRPGRNEMCWCGSGRKYKKCHLPEDEKRNRLRAEAACARNCGPT
jgi:uncharacterized protein YecA (UPF0149 family)